MYTRFDTIHKRHRWGDGHRDTMRWCRPHNAQHRVEKINLTTKQNLIPLITAVFIGLTSSAVASNLMPVSLS